MNHPNLKKKFQSYFEKRAVTIENCAACHVHSQGYVTCEFA